MYQTKDSGKRAVFDTGMVRDTQDGKARFDLVFPKNVPYEQQMLTRFAQLMGRGADKYDERNWEKAATRAELDRARSSALRHLIQWYHGEDDEDHAAAVMFNIMAAEYVLFRMRHVNVLAMLAPEVELVVPFVDDDDTPFTEPSALPIGEPTTGGPYACEMAGAHICSKHPGGWPGPTATGALKGS